MIALDLISEEIPPLKPSDDIMKALNWMEEFKVSQLPVVDNRVFLGLVSENDLIDLESGDTLLSKVTLNYQHAFSYGYQHIFEVVKILSDNNLSLVPVINEKEHYVGCISIQTLMKVIAEMSVVSDNGGVVVLELNINDYSLSEVAQIIEGNNAKILGTFITSHKDSTKLNLTLKVNKTDLGPILQTFNRYNYTVLASYDQGTSEDDLKDRFDSFMRYLDI